MHKKALSLLGAAALLAAAGAQAQDGSSIRWPEFAPAKSLYSVRAGLAALQPHSSATNATGFGIPPAPAAISLEVQNEKTLYLSLARALNENMELELALGYPPTHDVTAKLSGPLPANIQALNGETIARVRQMAPTLFFNYKFGTNESRWRPFVGVGVNYTKFDKRTSTANGNALNGGPTDIQLKDSWGLAAQVGLSYRVDERWTINGALATARVKTHLTTTTQGAQRDLDIRFHPRVFTLTAGYDF